jgi:hypothetical protein
MIPRAGRLVHVYSRMKLILVYIYEVPMLNSFNLIMVGVPLSESFTSE